MFPLKTSDSVGPGAWLARLLLGAVLLFAGTAGVAYLAARFIVWPNIDAVVLRYVGTLEERIGTSLTWKSIDTQWSGLRPSIEVIGPALGRGSQATQADRLYATISLRSLLQGQASLHDLVLDNPVVRLRRTGDTVSLAALGPKADRSAQSSRLAEWFLQQPDVRIGGGTVVVVDDADPGRNLRFDEVALVLRSYGRAHTARLDIGDGKALAASLVVQADLTRKAQAEPSDWRNWAGMMQLDGRQVAIQPLLAQLPHAARAALQDRLPAVVVGSVAGQLDPSISLQLDHGTMADGRIRLRSDDLALVLAETRDATSGAGVVRFSRINADLRMRRNVDGGTEISAAALELEEVGGARLRATSPQPVVTWASDGGVERLAAGFDRIVIHPTLGLAKLVAGAPGSGELADAIHRLSGRGELSDVILEWRRGSSERPASWRVRTAFDRVTVTVAPTERQVKHPWVLRIPDLQNLSGTVDAGEAGGKATLKTPPAPGQTPAPIPAGAPPLSMIRFGGGLVEPEVPFASLDAQFTWKIDHAAGAGWLSVQVDRLVFANADGSASATGRYQSGGRGPGLLDLRARVGSLRADRIWRYLPHEVPEDVRIWIRQAFEAGVLEAGEARWRGDIKDFPYRPNSPESQGEFRFTAKLREVLFKYDEDWPAIHGVGGDLVFDRTRMAFSADRGVLLELPVTAVSARMDDVASGRLEVDGRAQGDLRQLLKFVNSSPLVEEVGSVTRSMVASGPAALDLKLVLPLKDLKSTTAAGRVELSGATVEFEPAQVKFQNVSGRFDFTQASLRLERLRGNLSGMPVELSGQTGEPGTMRLQANGTLTSEGLRRLAGGELARHLNGSTPFSAEAEVGPRGIRLNLQSDLAGLASELPAPMSKAADAQWPFKLTMTPITQTAAAARAGAAADRIEASLGGEVLLVAERSRADARKPMQLARAALAVNRQPALPDLGMSFQFTGQRIDLDAWNELLGDGASGGGGPGLMAGAGSLPLLVSLVADEVRIADRNLSKVVLGASRTGSRWVANLSAREVNGYVTWSDTAGTAGKLTARLGRLEIPESQQQELAAALSTGPSSLPAMDIVADRFILGGFDFGRLELNASNSARLATQPAGAGAAARPRVWQMERLRLTMPSAVLEANGVWDRKTTLSYRLNLSDAGGFLNRLHLKDVVKGGSGAVSGELHWSGTPFSLDLPSLSGTADIAVRDGKFLKVEPGAAKLIGVLNLQALPKLLTLDFRDLFAQGFAFDELRGNVVILDGIASTDSLAMRGLQAVVQIKGQADLKASTQNLKVVVVPELNGGLATLAYAAIVNPAIGLGAFLAQSIFSQSLSRALAHEIDITGSWSDPTVVERRRERFGAPAGQ